MFRQHANTLKLSAATVLLTCGISLYPAAAHAQTVVYTQAPSAPTSFADTSAVWNNPADPGFTWTLDMDEQAWAYFRVATDISFNRISWYGSNADGDFAVDFFAASCFSCGLSWVNTGGGFTNNLLPNTSYNQAQVHRTLVSGSLYSYYIDLPSTLTLNHTSPYYALSVVNNYSSAPFQWARSPTGLANHLHYIRGQAMVVQAPGSLAFTLTNVLPPSPVPEPETYAMLLAGLGLMGFTSRRRKKSA